MPKEYQISNLSSRDSCQDLNAEQLEKLRLDTLSELSELDADFTASNSEMKSLKGSELKQELEWRANAVEQKKDILVKLRAIKTELKIKNADLQQAQFKTCG